MTGHEISEDDRDDAAPQWLDAGEKETWTGFASIMLLLPGRLEAPLRQEHGLTLFEYFVLSHVSEAPERRLRMGELAHLANGSLSRLSNVVKRLERQGYVRRSPDPDDGRYTLAELTDPGMELVRSAAPTHLDAVRRLVLDPLEPGDQEALRAVVAKLRLGGLQAE